MMEVYKNKIAEHFAKIEKKINSLYMDLMTSQEVIDLCNFFHPSDTFLEELLKEKFQNARRNVKDEASIMRLINASALLKIFQIKKEYDAAMMLNMFETINRAIEEEKGYENE